MQLSETVRLYPTAEQDKFIRADMQEYIATVNSLVKTAVSGTSIAKYTTKDVKGNLPSAIRNQCIRDAKSIIKKHYKNCRKTVLENRHMLKRYGDTAPLKIANKLPEMKKPCLYVNNQNFSIKGTYLSFPVMKGSSSTRIMVKTKLTERQAKLLSNATLGTMRIVQKNNQLVAQIVYEKEENQIRTEGNVMGVDLGIKCPAVCYSSNERIKFLGNGRKHKYMRRQYAYRRKKLQEAKKQKVLERINHKEQRIMKDIDHKISHDIVEMAVKNDVNVIKLEQLTNIRSTTRKSRKNNHSLHTWSFYRLTQYIEYKAKLAGIEVLYVNPAYTSQMCPACGKKHHAKDRNYVCKCGCHIHRDLVGAINICNSTEFVGNRQTA